MTLNNRGHITHYASQYYDPVKAREYYLKNRQLKGRTKTGMSEDQKQAWDYAKDNISTEKKQKIKTASTDKEKKIEVERAKAAETRERISQMFKLLAERLSETTKDTREDLSDKLKAELDSLPPVPKNLSPEAKAKFMEKRKKEIADIRGKAAESRDTLTEDTKKTREKNSSDSKKGREQVRTELKASIESIRSEFTKQKESLNADYEKTYQKEYDNIRKNVKEKPQGGKKK